MQIKDTVLVLVGASASMVLAAPAGENNQIRQGIPFLNPSGSGLANANLILGGGILPTFTLGGALAGGDNQIGFGGSQTLGIGGGPLPTLMAGGGFGMGIDTNNIIMQNSGTLSEGGYLNGFIPTFQAGGALNNQLGFRTSSGIDLAADVNGGAGATLGYGGNFISSSTLALSLGGGLGANKLYYLALNLAVLDSANAYDLDGLFNGGISRLARAPQMPMDGVSFPPPLSVFEYLSCRLSAAISNDMLPIWEQPTPADCPPLFGESSSGSESPSPTDSSSEPSAATPMAASAASSSAESSPAASSPAESSPAESSPAESSPAESSPAEPSPAAASPAESSPAESSPAESSPAESSPAESSPAEPSPAAARPAESSPAESSPAESSPAESSPAESSPAESSPAESSPAESSPAESSPAESSPAESSPAESSPAESSPAEPSPAAASPAESSPAESSPAESSPAESSPAESSPAESSPAESSPAESSPAESSPAGSSATPAPARAFFRVAKREPQNTPSPTGPGPILPSISGNGVIQGDVVLGGGILPTLTLGGIIDGNNNGFGAGASATVGLGGRVLPTVAVGGGASAGINNMIINGAVSGTVSEGGWLSGIIPPANAGASLGAEGGVLVSNGIHGILGANGGAWATLGYGGIFIPSSTIAANIGGNVGVLLDNARATPTSSSP
ncbi:hypothetical protein BX667DRAFT_529874 [Coemansia mojavensis]|nr:hypothetical protein BX667DRAFT_529874 [Coemansia mojavensis]